MIAAAFAEAAEKREAAEAAVAAIGDPKKVAMVRDDALKAEAHHHGRAPDQGGQQRGPARGEDPGGGGGGDGRALRVQGVRKSEKSFGAKRPESPGEPPAGARANAPTPA